MIPDRTRALLACTLVLASTAAQARVAGSCDYKDRHYDFVDGAAWDVAPATALGFATFALDQGELARAGNRRDELGNQAWGQDARAARLLLTVQDGKVLSLSAWLPPTPELVRDRGDLGAIEPVAGNGLAGIYRYADADDELWCSLDYDIAVLGDPADAPALPGTPLPADGGEPGRVYLAVNRALLAGDLDAIAKLLPPARLARMEEARKSPDFAEQLEMMQAMASTDVRITGGRVEGDTAWVEFTGKSMGSPVLGTVEMIRLDGRWYVETESTRPPD